MMKMTLTLRYENIYRCFVQLKVEIYLFNQTIADAILIITNLFLLVSTDFHKYESNL